MTNFYKYIYSAIHITTSLLFFVPAVYSQNQYIDREIYSRYISGLYRSKIGDWGGALNDFESAYKLKPNSSEIIVRYSEALLRLNRIKEAEKIALESLKFDSTNADAYLILAEIALNNEEIYRADSYLQQRLKYKPDDLESRIRLGLLRESIGNIEGVVEAFKGYPARKPGAAIADFHLGLALSKLKRYREAIEAFKDSLGENRNYLEAAINIALLYEELEDDSKALEAWQDVLKMDPDNNEAYSHIISFYIASQKYSDATNLIQQLIEKNPDKRVNLLKLLGQLALQSGDLSLATHTMDELARVNKTETSYLEVAFIAAKSGKETDIMLSALKSAWEINYRPAIGLIYLQALLLTDKNADTPNQLIDLLSEKIEAETKLLFAFALLTYKANNETRAIEIMQKVIEYEPLNAEALNFVGYSWAEKGINLDKAEEYIRRALSVEPDNPQYIDSLGWIFYQKGLYDIARLHVEKAYQLMRDEPEIIEHLGDIYTKLGRTDDAVTFYRKALSSKKTIDRNRIESKLKVLETLP